MGEISYLSKEGMENLKIEIQELKTNGRKEMSQQINEAREKGDLAENAEYHAAKEAQGLMEMKIAKLEELLMNARLLDESKLIFLKFRYLLRLNYMILNSIRILLIS